MLNRTALGFVLSGVASLLLNTSIHAMDTPTALELFESKIRPVLITHCYECHNSHELAEGELAVDHRQALIKGGVSGPLIVPGNSAESLLLRVLRHEVPGMEMPQGGAKLSDGVIRDFERWIELGAVDPRDQPPSPEELAQATNWDAVFAKRLEWWSFQPIRHITPPSENLTDASMQPIDQFLLDKLKANGLAANPIADSHVLVRRAFIALHGLPPTPDQLQHWTAALNGATDHQRDLVWEQLIDELLASPRYGERWSRHWMDWIRYAESHGSEGDPRNANAWFYRDYLIRALNADVSYDQLVREHIAGDLLADPRLNHEVGINESAIGASHWRMVFHGFSPTDALDERVRFTDDQINAFSKAFLAVTVSCARCHNHKFDAISQADYYSIFGILESCRPGRITVDLPELQQLHQRELLDLSEEIQTAVAQNWREQLAERVERWTSSLAEKPTNSNQAELAKLISRLQQRPDGTPAKKGMEERWQTLVQEHTALQQAWDAFTRRTDVRVFDLADARDAGSWYLRGQGLASGPVSPGATSLAVVGSDVLRGIYPAGVYSHLVSDKDAARIESPDWPMDGEYQLHTLAVGGGGASLRYAVHDYPRNGTIYPVTTLTDNWTWHRFDVAYWRGDTLHLELSTSLDAPLLTGNQERSWIGMRQAILSPGSVNLPAWPSELTEALIVSAQNNVPTDETQLTSLLCVALEQAINDWEQDRLNDAQTALLEAARREGLLPNAIDELSTVQSALQRYRELESERPVPRRVPAIEETVAADFSVFVRGNHRQLGPLVPRQFLSAFDSRPYETQQSGRLELAEDVLSVRNPLTRRVIVNRLWHHLFGSGLVSTPDNFGRLGAEPSHPELLDWLAAKFSEDGWSLKRAIRSIMLTETWQRDSTPTAESLRADPDNRWLGRANVRRMEAEVIRDTLLMAAGTLDLTMGGPPVNEGASRRSVYLPVIRNDLDPFLRAFDFPEPFSTVGQRDSTNVPAQSLAMLNSPRVANYASSWAQRLLDDGSLKDDRQRLVSIFEQAFGREPTAVELSQVEQYLTSTQRVLEERTEQAMQLQTELMELRQQINAVIEPARNRLLVAESETTQTALQEVPQPIYEWQFDDAHGKGATSLDGELFNGAKLEAGALVASGGYLMSEPLSQALGAKTIEAWVQLDSLEQAGGGVISVQSIDGVYFDAIVFGEQAPRQWLAGSNNFARTRPFGGAEELDAANRPVHLAIVYAADGTITGYRDGEPYGEPYKTDGPYPFAAGNTRVGFGIRHYPAQGNRLLAGTLFGAKLYDRALTGEEVRAASRLRPEFISDSAVLDTLSPEDHQRVVELRQRVATIEAGLKSYEGESVGGSRQRVWTELVSAMLLAKELIYVR